MYCIGLTGYIASGKSTVAAFFKTKNIAVISADSIARKLTEPDKPAFIHIKSHFGEQILTQYGELNRLKLREIIVNNPEERSWLEQQLHPLIRHEIRENIKTATSPYCIIEIPLLYKRDDYPYLNRVLLITITPEKQIQRLMERDKIDRQLAQSMIKLQTANTPNQCLAEDIFLNTSSMQALEYQVNKFHRLYMDLSKK